MDRSEGGSSSARTPVDVLAFNRDDPAFGPGDTFELSQLYGQRLSRQAGAYATLRLTFWSPLHLTAGVRYNYRKRSDVSEFFCTATEGCTLPDTGAEVPFRGSFGEFGGGFSTSDFSWPPNLSAALDLTRNLSSYVSYQDIYQDQSDSLDVNRRPLDPIRGTNIEGGIKWSGREGRLNASLSAYRIRQRNFGTFVGFSENGQIGDGCCYTSDSDFVRKSQGVDAELTGEMLPGWQLSGSYTWNKNEFEGVDSFLEGLPLQSQLPEHLFKLWTTYQFQKGDWLRRMTVGAGVTAQSSGYSAGSACTAFAPGTGLCTGGFEEFDFIQKSYAVVSASVAYRVSPSLQITANFNNILNKKYYQTVNTPQRGNWYGDPRNFQITVRGQF